MTTCQEAELAREKGNGYRLDRAHVLAVNIFDDFEKYMKVPDEWTPAELKPYASGVCLFYFFSPLKYIYFQP